MSIGVVGKFFIDDGDCQYFEWDCLSFDECDNDDDNMFNALLCAHQIISNGDGKWLSIGEMDDNGYDIIDNPIDVLNIMVFYPIISYEYV